MRNIRIVLTVSTDSKDSKFIKSRLRMLVLPAIQTALKKFGFQVSPSMGFSIEPETPTQVSAPAEA